MPKKFEPPLLQKPQSPEGRIESRDLKGIEIFAFCAAMIVALFVAVYTINGLNGVAEERIKITAECEHLGGKLYGVNDKDYLALCVRAYEVIKKY